MKNKIAAAAVAVALIMGAGIGYYGIASLAPTRTVTRLCGQQVNNATSVSETDCQAGLTLTLGIENATIAPGYDETVYVSIRNELATSNLFGLSGLPTLPRLILSPLGSVYELPPFTCGQKVPAWIIMYNESGFPVQLNDVPPPTGPSAVCGSTSIGIPYQFSPRQALTETLSVGGCWHSSNKTEPWTGATYSQFGPGQYTVLAYDGWNQPVTLSFSVG